MLSSSASMRNPRLDAQGNGDLGKTTVILARPAPYSDTGASASADVTSIQRAGRTSSKRNASSRPPSIPPWIIKGEEYRKVSLGSSRDRVEQRSRADKWHPYHLDSSFASWFKTPAGHPSLTSLRLLSLPLLNEKGCYNAVCACESKLTKYNFQLAVAHVDC